MITLCSSKEQIQRKGQLILYALSIFTLGSLISCDLLFFDSVCMYIEGGDLFQYLQQQTDLSWENVIKVATGIGMTIALMSNANHKQREE